jgi:hypothetical protein
MDSVTISHRGVLGSPGGGHPSGQYRRVLADAAKSATGPVVSAHSAQRSAVAGTPAMRAAGT